MNISMMSDEELDAAALELLDKAEEYHRAARPYLEEIERRLLELCRKREQERKGH